MSTDFYSFDWLDSFDGVVGIELEGESPTRRRVELATEEKTELLTSVLNLMGCQYRRLTPTLVVIEPLD